MIRVLIADDAPSALGNMARLIAAQPDMEVAETVTDGASAIESATRLRPEVLLIDAELPGVDGLSATERIHSTYPECRVVVMGLDDDEGALTEAHRRGAAGYLVKPFTGSELVLALRGAAGVGSPSAPAPSEPTRTGAPSPTDDPLGPRQQPVPLRFGSQRPEDSPARGEPLGEAAATDGSGNDWTPFGSSLTPQAPPPAPERPEPSRLERMQAPDVLTPARPQAAMNAEAMPGLPAPRGNGQLFALVGGKGGVGTSVLAANLAILLARETGRRVGLVDLDDAGGDVGTLLRVAPPPETPTMLELSERGPGADRSAVEAALVPTAHGIFTVLSRLRHGPPLAAEAVDTALGHLRTLCDFVIVDVPSRLGPAQLVGLGRADRLVLVSGMSETAVRGSQRLLAQLNALQPGVPAPVLVLNRAEANSDFTRERIEEILGVGVALQLPYDPVVVTTSVNRGAPFVAANPEAPATRRVRQLAALLVPNIHAETESELVARRLPDTPRRKQRRGLFGGGRG